MASYYKAKILALGKASIWPLDRYPGHLGWRERGRIDILRNYATMLSFLICLKNSNIWCFIHTGWKWCLELEGKLWWMNNTIEYDFVVYCPSFWFCRIKYVMSSLSLSLSPHVHICQCAYIFIWLHYESLAEWF